MCAMQTTVLYTVVMFLYYDVMAMAIDYFVGPNLSLKKYWRIIGIWYLDRREDKSLP